jgi:hypothetical protein
MNKEFFHLNLFVSALCSSFQVTTTPVPPGKISIILPYNYMSILSNLGLLTVSVGEFIVAAIASYKSSRVLCPCFRRKGDYLEELNNRNALVSSWLGKHSPTPHVYVVAPSSLGKGSKVRNKKCVAVRNLFVDEDIS